MKGNGHIYTQGELRPGPPMATTHSESEQREISERYVRGKLAPQERLAFEEHFFVCDECFQQVQMMERFTAGMHHAAETGKLASPVTEERAPGLFAAWRNWLTLGFATTAIACLVLTATLSWVILRQLPRLRGELAQERQLREQVEAENRQRLKSTSARLETERQERLRLESQLEQERQIRSERQPDSPRRPSGTEDQIAMATTPQPNVPVAALQATRDAESAVTKLAVPDTARSVVLWIEVESGRFESFRLQIYSADNRPVQTVTGLKRNNGGALAVSLAAQSLPPGIHTVKLYGEGKQQAELVGSYRLRVVRP